MCDGWVKLHRKLLKSTIFTNANLLQFWIWCLLNASHEEHKQRVGLQEVTLQKGQFVFGRKAVADDLGISPSTCERYLKKLVSEGVLERIPNNKFTVVTVVKWEVYQSVDYESEHQKNNKKTSNEQQMNNSRTSNEQQVNTNKNDKNVKNDKKEEKGTDPALPARQKNLDYSKIMMLYNSICIDLPKVQDITDSRKNKIRTLVSTISKLDRFKDIDRYEQLTILFQMAHSSDFLNGRTNKNTSWCSFDWIIISANAVKILEGNYKNDKEAGNNGLQQQNKSNKSGIFGMAIQSGHVSEDIPDTIFS